jgi:hypothetical protein
MCFVLFYIRSSFSQGERPLDIKTFFPVISLLLVSCAGDQPTIRPTIDATQRWLNAKCPPSEVCTPQNEPERIGDAYLKAVLAGECHEAASYWAFDLQNEIVENCQQGISLTAENGTRCRLTQYEIEKVLIENIAGGKSTKFSGNFLYVCDDISRDYQANNLKLFFNNLNGKWRIIGIDP